MNDSVYFGSIQHKVDSAEQLIGSGGLCGGIYCQGCPCEGSNCDNDNLAKRVELAVEFLREREAIDD